MSAHRTHESFEFRLEVLEGRSLLSGIPCPDAADVTLLNGQHPVATETFLDPDEDWTVAQGGHDMMPPPPSTFLNDDDMHGFVDDDLAWADQWDSADINNEYAQYDDFDPADYAGITGLPGAATQHGGPKHVAPQGPVNFEIPVGGFDAAADEPAIDAQDDDTTDGEPEVAVLRPLDAQDAPSFLDFTGDPGVADSSAALFTFGAPAKSSFMFVESRKPGVVGTFVGE
jgi:hypothetical protein